MKVAILKRIFSFVFLWLFLDSIFLFPVLASTISDSQPRNNLLLPDLPPSFLTPIKRVVLPNGAIVLVKGNHKGVNVAVSVLVRAGNETEEMNMGGIRFFISRLILSGLVQSPSLSSNSDRSASLGQPANSSLLADAIASKSPSQPANIGEAKESCQTAIENLGGVLDAEVPYDYIEFKLLIPKKSFKKGFGILKQSILDFDFNDKVVESVRKEVLERQNETSQEAYSFLYDVFLKNFYTFHPYRFSLLGTPKSIKEMTKEALAKFHKEIFIPNNIIITIVGPMDAEETIKIVEEEFKKYPGGKPPLPTFFYEPQIEENKTLYYAGDGSVSWVFLGYGAPPVKSDDYEAMQVINQILGTGLSSRMWMELREKLGLAYQLGSNFPGRYSSSHIVFFAATNRQSIDETKKIMLKELDKIKNTVLTEEELVNAKRMLLGRFLLEIESSRAKASFIVWSEALGKGYLYERLYIDRVLSLTSQKIQSVAKNYLGKYVLILAE